MTEDWSDFDDGVTVQSAAYLRTRRKRRTAITLIVLIVVLAGVYFYASSYWNRPAGSSAAKSTCTPTIPADGSVAAGDFELQVFNSTSRNGLAASTAKELKARGYNVVTIANDPAKSDIAEAAEVRFGPRGERAAQAVLALVPGSVPVKDEARTGTRVDLVLGDAFSTLAPASEVPNEDAAVPTDC